MTLRAPLRDLAGGTAEVQVDGRTVGEAVRAVEDAYPPIRGWILDEHGSLRPHVNVFVDGERCRETTSVAPDAVLHVLSAISGGER